MRLFQTKWLCYLRMPGKTSFIFLEFLIGGREESAPWNELKPRAVVKKTVVLWVKSTSSVCPHCQKGSFFSPVSSLTCHSKEHWFSSWGSRSPWILYLLFIEEHRRNWGVGAEDVCKLTCYSIDDFPVQHPHLKIFPIGRPETLLNDSPLWLSESLGKIFKISDACASLWIHCGDLGGILQIFQVIVFLWAITSDVWEDGWDILRALDYVMNLLL